MGLLCFPLGFIVSGRVRVVLWGQIGNVEGFPGIWNPPYLSRGYKCSLEQEDKALKLFTLPNLSLH